MKGEKKSLKIHSREAKLDWGLRRRRLTLRPGEEPAGETEGENRKRCEYSEI